MQLDRSSVCCNQKISKGRTFSPRGEEGPAFLRDQPTAATHWTAALGGRAGEPGSLATSAPSSYRDQLYL